MKILLITDLYPIDDFDDTIPKAIEDFALSYLKYKNELCVIRANFIFNSFIRKHKIYKQKEYTRNNIKIYNRNFLSPFLFENNKFIEKIQKENFDIIISHMPSGHLYACLINKKLKLKRVAILHQSDFEVLNNFKYSIYFKNKLKKAIYNSNLIGARNNFLKKKLNADFLYSSFINEENIKEKKAFLNDETLKIITLSKLIKRKNIDLIIKALVKINFPFEYEIYGKGKEEKRLKKLIKKLNLENKIKIYPHINHDEIYEKLDNNDVFILTSKKESFGLCYFEAISRGLIPICTKNTGIDGIIENNINGYSIEAKIENIVDVLEKIYHLEKSQKTELLKNIHSLALKYSQKNSILNYLKIFNSCL